MIKPILEYAYTIWSQYTQKNIDLVEAVQRQSASYSSYASVSEMLTLRPYQTEEMNLD